MTCRMCGRESHGFTCAGLLECEPCGGTMLDHKDGCVNASARPAAPKLRPDQLPTWKTRRPRKDTP